MAGKQRALAYSKLFESHRSARIFLGEDPEAWNRCGRESKLGWTDFLLLPSGKDPVGYCWPVQGLDVLIFNFRGTVQTKRIHQIMLACIDASAILVTALLPDNTLMAQP